MKAQEILSKIKEVVGIELSEEVSVQLEEIKLENGTILEAEKFESGQSVFIKTEEENIKADSATSVCCFIRVPNYSL